MKTESETDATLNTFFSNIVKNLDISRYLEIQRSTKHNCNSQSILSENISFYWGWHQWHGEWNTEIK